MRTLLIVGFGDIAIRALPQLKRRWRVLAAVRSEHGYAAAHRHGITAIRADLDQPATLPRLAGLAHAILYCAPPPGNGLADSRLRHFLRAQAKANSITQHMVYISTSGVYGDAGGQWLDETSPTHPLSSRARRRLDAEQQLRHFCRRHGGTLTILRAPGIYAAERLPLQRIAAGTPCIQRTEDRWSNHIHADDLARLCVAALEQRGGIRCYNACDDEPTLSGDWFDMLADHYQLPRPPRLPYQEVADRLSPAQWSFLNESRRLSNRRLRHEFGITLQWPTVRHWLEHAAAAPAAWLAST